MRANERTDERVAQYLSLNSWLLSTIVVGWKEKGQEKHQETKGGAVKCDNTFGLLFSLPIFAFEIRLTDVIVECIAYWIKHSFARGKKSPP